MNGKKITHVQKGSTRMHFFYDAQGRPSLIRYNGVDYAYLHNLQGDVVGMIDMDGTRVVEYTYDAWGKPQRTMGGLAATLGKDNPFRYRGYVYDEETGLYYLRSRYYDPQWGRFLNADVALGKGGALGAHNAFCYCDNSPSIHSDSIGSLKTKCIDPDLGIYAFTINKRGGGTVDIFFLDEQMYKTTNEALSIFTSIFPGSTLPDVYQWLPGELKSVEYHEERHTEGLTGAVAYDIIDGIGIVAEGLVSAAAIAAQAYFNKEINADLIAGVLSNSTGVIGELWDRPTTAEYTSHHLTIETRCGAGEQRAEYTFYSGEMQNREKKEGFHYRLVYYPAKNPLPGIVRTGYHSMM